ncbi:MAG: GatB/YqeY domain-containing protein [Actinobacteria bacterium]|uniref:Unannotated protein n=1 Tax=freshwater metagenome TaxID=449393 RepID=A0A6J5ZNG8_9ZZZZ|nr:GatB/YqeY domain-containing protein [Actinomycetota bacterium]
MSTFKEQLHNDLNKAIKSRDTLTMGTLRMVLSAITNEEVSGKVAKELSDQEVMTVLNREAKKRKEAATAYDDAKRPELAKIEREELAIIEAYLPEAMSESELDAIISAAVAQVLAQGSSGPSAMGAVMKIVTPAVAGRADGSSVASKVKAALS